MRFRSALVFSLLTVFSGLYEAWLFYWCVATAWNKDLLTAMYEERVNWMGLLSFSWLLAFSIAALISRPQLQMPKLRLGRKPKEQPKKDTGFDL